MNLEGQYQEFNWGPPLGSVLSPGFKATMEALDITTTKLESGEKMTKRFIDNLEKRGYCIAFLPDTK